MDKTHEENEELFGIPCPKCGKVTVFADDATYQVNRKKREQNHEKLIEKMENIKKYLNNNELSMNQGKMTLLECMVSQKKGRTTGLPPSIIITTAEGNRKEIIDKGTCKILGARMQANMTLGTTPNEGGESTAAIYEQTAGSPETPGEKNTTKL